MCLSKRNVCTSVTAPGIETSGQGSTSEVRVGQAGGRKVTTMTSAVLVDIRDEVTCPICLELLTEPMSLDCGHSFCQACITGNSKQSEISQEGGSSCPVCRTSYQPGNLRPNRHLANIVERLREAVLGPEKQLKVILCTDHGEKLQLFCKEDGKIICWLCERSLEHRDHQTFLVEEVAQEYQEMFQESLKKLKKEQQEVEKLTAVVRKKKSCWKDVNDVMERNELWTLKKPKALPTKLRSEFRAPDLKKMLRVFRELTDLQSCWVDVTLNPQTANLNLLLSKNRRQVRFVGAKLPEPSCLREHYDCGILGTQQFSTGKHYWEVDVTNKTDWILGVCSNSVVPAFSFYQYANNQNVCSSYRPQSGYWVIGLKHKHEYRAYEDSSTSLLLLMTVPPRRVGIFLDYEAGIVSFYNVTNHGFPIYTFSKYYFPTPLCPYFNPCNCVVPMTLRYPRS
ncbi:tripartite motif-containing protein 6 isoform X3 [Loxodonta africana]|uniref:tripartite motif-containing protein 6 isoform X3 n=1 Tax=Loxodonta africana TaxID=9785 RepID=UPI000C8118EC|nr:tripartite motif-containing protein 6 isoform X3 [Loxodonta africana]